MGLDIKEYSYSYFMLQRLRQAALVALNIKMDISEFYEEYKSKRTKCDEFLWHCDCEGIYISKTSKQYNKFAEIWKNSPQSFGDLDKLKKELLFLDPKIKIILSQDLTALNAWNAFYRDTMSSRKIMEFR